MAGTGLVSNPDDEIFFLFTSLAALKPPTAPTRNISTASDRRIRTKTRSWSISSPHEIQTGNQRRKRRSGVGVRRAGEKCRGEQVLKVAHRVKDGVETVGEQVQGVDDKVRDVGDQVNLAVEGHIRLDGKVVKATTLETQALLQQTANNIDTEMRSESLTRAWLSPPGPSINQNIASTAQHYGTATWFFQGSLFLEWKSKAILAVDPRETGFREEHSLLRNHPRYNNFARGWTSLCGSIVKYEGMARNENTLSIVLEYAENGSLGQTLKAFGKLNEKLVESYEFKILEGLDYLHRSDVVHCDFKVANIITTKTGNVKLSDLPTLWSRSTCARWSARSRTSRARRTGWPRKSSSLKARHPSLTSGRLVHGYRATDGTPAVWGYRECDDSFPAVINTNETHTVMSPPIPERFPGPRVAFLKECVHKDPSMRPSAEQLFEHELLKNHWGLNMDLRPQDSIPFLRRVSANLQKNGAARHSMVNLELDSPVPVYAGQQFDGDKAMLSSSPGHRSFTGSASPVLPEVPQSDADLFEIREHTFVKTTFSKRASPVINEREPDLRANRSVAVNCRVCMEPAKKGALCSHCSHIAHSKCAGRAALTCDLRSKLLMHAHFAERGSSPTEFFPRLPNHHPASASSSRGSLDRDRDQRVRERTNSPQLSPTSSPYPPIACKVLSPFNKRSRASLTPDPTHSNSYVLIAGATPSQAKVTSVIPEGNVIHRKLSIILTRQREPQQVNNTHLRERPQSISSCATSPQSPASQSPQSNSLRSLQAFVAAAGNSSSASSASRAARVDPSAATTASSFVDAAVDVAGASCVTVPDTAAPTVASRDKKRMMTMMRRARGDSSKASNGGNCSIH
ncbi:hypothetical protein H4582DRAFT_2060353 [Lactarius indigo]|nr:hypothetical protein H4582DRAFT_2060353 [Lactarius indigo]